MSEPWLVLRTATVQFRISEAQCAGLSSSGVRRSAVGTRRPAAGSDACASEGMEGQAPSPVEARFAPGAPCPLQQHYARMLMQQQHAVPTSAGTAHVSCAVFPYLSALSNNASSPGGSPLGPLGSFRAPHTSPNMAAMRQFWPPTPPPDMSTSPGYSRYGGSYYSLFPPLSSPPDPFGPPGSLFPRLAHSASHYPSLLDRDGGFLSQSLGSPLSHYASALSPLASSSLLSPPTSTSTGTDLSHPGKVLDEPITPTTHSHADSLLTTVAPLNSSTQSVRPLSKPPNAHTKDRCSEKSRSKKSSQKSTNKSGPTDLSMGATQATAGRTKTVEKCSHCTCKQPPQNCGTVTSASWSEDLSNNGGTAATVGVASSPPTEPSTTVGMSLHCIPSDQVTSTVPSPSAHPPPLLSPTGPAVVSSSTPDVSLTPPTPEAAADSPVSNTPPLHSPPQSSLLRNLSPMPKAMPELSTSSQKDTSVFVGGDCSSTTGRVPCHRCRGSRDARQLCDTFNHVMPMAPVNPVAAVVPRLPSPKEEKEEMRPECRYTMAVTKREPADLEQRATGPALVPLGKNAVMLSVQQTKVVSQTRLRGGSKSSGLAVGVAKASAKTTSVFSTPLGSGTGSPKVQEVAPVNLKISKSCEAVLQKPDGATSTGIPTCVAVATRRPQEAGGSKIVVEEKCDTTVSVVPALSVLNASSQPIPVGIAVAQQRQDHTITCSKTSLSSSAAEQSHITAVSCSTVILAAGGSDRGPRLCESRQGPAAHQGMAETTTTCLVTAGPVPAHTTWDSHSDALAIRPAAAALPWLTTPAPPVVTTPTIWLPQEATPPPLASPGGFQLARDTLTGQLYLVPAAPTSWTLSGAATASPVQQILTTQQHTTFQQIMPDQWRSELKPTATASLPTSPKHRRGSAVEYWAPSGPGFERH
ncbi:hypothetical protein HPB51_009964 [Rhipicephalus microplus]|uniref:Uncharacterized protein n=1 Tax=Rhipicephalus microplus TaxID=6941 RepID=A0A9J6ESL9_RHIMP|nr:hypothetical protein HPB51_009964 [Rhipicephalus microplus]